MPDDQTPTQAEKAEPTLAEEFDKAVDHIVNSPHHTMDYGDDPCEAEEFRKKLEALATKADERKKDSK